MLNFFLNQNVSLNTGNSLSANPTSIYYLYGAGSGFTTITITPNGTPLFYASQTWIGYSYNSTNKRLTITVEENFNEFGRLGFVDITHPLDSSITVRINIEQSGYN